ncbi:MAG TPA: GNAT family N-acetyltransferase [Candidatus Eisenbacteria bacterium]
MASDPCATAAHRAGLWEALAQTLPGMEARFIAVEGEGALSGGAPLLIERRAGLHWIHALPYLLPGAPLAARGARPEVDTAVARELARLQRELRAVGGEWSLYRIDEDPPAESALEETGGETRLAETAVVDLTQGLDAAWARMERKTRQAIHSARAHGLAFAEEPEALGEAYALYLRQSRGWKGHRRRPIELSRRLLAASPAPAADGGAPRGGGEPLARLFTVRDARGLLGAVLGLDHPREILPWWSGVHPDARGRQAFVMLLGSVVEWAAGAGRARVNLGASAGLPAVASFKRALGARAVPHPVRWLDARHATPAGRLVAAAQSMWRRERARGARA